MCWPAPARSIKLLPGAAWAADTALHSQGAVQGRSAHELEATVERHRPVQAGDQATRNRLDPLGHAYRAAVRVGRQHQEAAAAPKRDAVPTWPAAVRR